MNHLRASLALLNWNVLYQTVGKWLTLLTCLYCFYVMGEYGYRWDCLSAVLLAGASTLFCLFFTAFTWAFIRVTPGKSLIGMIGAVCAALVV